MSRGTMTVGSATAPALLATGISKRYGQVAALSDVSIEIKRGEIVALFGDNGAGKSTLLEILCGTISPDEGAIYVAGERLELGSIKAFQEKGIDAVHQDLGLAPDLMVYESLFLGRELVQPGVAGRLGFLRRKQMKAAAAKALTRLELDTTSVDSRVGSLSGGQRQAVAISRAVMWTDRVLLLDEPTAALGAHRTDMVGDLIRAIAAEGLGVLIVSHDLPRVLALADRVVILWHGRLAVDCPASELTVPEAIRLMVTEPEKRHEQP